LKEKNIYELYQKQLQSIVSKILTHYHNFAILFGMENFMPILDFFIEEAQIEVNKNILAAFAKYLISIFILFYYLYFITYFIFIFLFFFFSLFFILFFYFLISILFFLKIYFFFFPDFLKIVLILLF
jgi:hypothetical protein